MEFDPVNSRKAAAGWSRDKQAEFLRCLAAGGSVTQAAESVGMSTRSAYYLRGRPDAASFRDAWDRALVIASGALMAIACDRAIHGTTRQIWREGELVAEEQQPSDRLLMWLLAHNANQGAGHAARITAEAAQFAKHIATLQDAPLTALDVEEAREQAEIEALRIEFSKG